jgi:hypothetical protein
LRHKQSFSGTELSGSVFVIIPAIIKEYALKVTRILCEVYEFGGVEIISKNKNLFPNCRGDIPLRKRIVFMTRNYWLRISKVRLE